MNTECFIKSFLLIAVIFLIIKCWSNNESFANIDFTLPSLAGKVQNYKPVELKLSNINELEFNKLDDDKKKDYEKDYKYVFVAFDQLNKEKRKNITDKLKDNSEFMNLETIQDVEKEIFYKNPIFLVTERELESNNIKKLDFILIPESGSYALSSSENKYLYFNEKLGLTYFAKNGPNNDLILVSSNGFVKLFGLEENWANTNFKTIKKIDDKNLRFKITIN